MRVDHLASFPAGVKHNLADDVAAGQLLMRPCGFIE
jgi:hypothetical protein